MFNIKVIISIFSVCFLGNALCAMENDAPTGGTPSLGVFLHSATPEIGSHMHAAQVPVRQLHRIRSVDQLKVDFENRSSELLTLLSGSDIPELVRVFLKVFVDSMEDLERNLANIDQDSTDHARLSILVDKVGELHQIIIAPRPVDDPASVVLRMIGSIVPIYNILLSMQCDQQVQTNIVAAAQELIRLLESEEMPRMSLNRAQDEVDLSLRAIAGGPLLSSPPLNQDTGRLADGPSQLVAPYFVPTPSPPPGPQWGVRPFTPIPSLFPHSDPIPPFDHGSLSSMRPAPRPVVGITRPAAQQPKPAPSFWSTWKPWGGAAVTLAAIGGAWYYKYKYLAQRDSINSNDSDDRDVA